MINNTIQPIKNMKECIEEGQKTPKAKKNTNQNKNPSFGYSSIPSSKKLRRRLFSGTRKQAGRSLRRGRAMRLGQNKMSGEVHGPDP